MLPAEITSTAAKPRMIFARNLRVGNSARLDGDAIRPDIPTPICIQPRSGGAPPPAAMRKTRAESIRGGKFGRPAMLGLIGQRPIWVISGIPGWSKGWSGAPRAQLPGGPAPQIIARQLDQ